MKNRKRRMRKFLGISLAVTILAVVTVFVLTPFLPSLAEEESKEEESDYEKDPLVVEATATPDEGVAPLEVTFEALASGGKCDSYKYKWSGEVTGSEASATKTFEDPGTYKATVKVTCGKGEDKEEVTETASVEVVEPLEVSVSAIPGSGVAPLDVTFIADASGGTGSYTYTWSGKVTGGGDSVSATFEEAGTYTATVTVTSGKQTESDSASVTVEEEEEEEEEALIVLGGTKTGKRIAKAIIKTGTNIEFGELAEDVVAEYVYDPETETSTITINEDLQNAPSKELATLLAHEGVHALYRDKDYSSHQEYKAWEKEAETAKELGVDSDAVDLIYDEDGKERTEEEAIEILESDTYGYEFPDRP